MMEKNILVIDESNVNIRLDKFIKDNTNLPVAVGFGIKNSNDVKKTKEYADGAIIGTKIVEITSKFNPTTAHQKIKELFE